MVTFIEESELENVGKITGWLLLPGIGLVWGIVGSTLSLVGSGTEVWTQPSVEAAVGLMFGLAWLGFTGTVAGFFFSKHHWAPRLYVAMLTINAILGGLGLATALLSGDLANLAGLRDAIRAIVVAGIWIPYFAVSRRVKQTFVHHWRERREAEPV